MSIQLGIASSSQFSHGALMKPHRYEWLRVEQERVTKEGTGSAHLRYLFAEHAKRMLGLSLAVILIVYLMDLLPRRPDGAVQPLPLLAGGVLLAVIGFGWMRLRKPIATVERWAAWTIVYADALFCLACPILWFDPAA